MRALVRAAPIAMLPLIAALGVTLLQNRQVTGNWTDAALLGEPVSVRRAGAANLPAEPDTPITA